LGRDREGMSTLPVQHDLPTGVLQLRSRKDERQHSGTKGGHRLFKDGEGRETTDRGETARGWTGEYVVDRLMHFLPWGSPPHQRSLRHFENPHHSNKEGLEEERGENKVSGHGRRKEGRPGRRAATPSGLRVLKTYELKLERPISKYERYSLKEKELATGYPPNGTRESPMVTDIGGQKQR